MTSSLIHRYHESLFKARKAHYEARQAALQFERAAMMQKRSKTLQTQYEGQLAKGEGGAGGAAGKADLERKLKNATTSVDEAEERKKKASKLHGVKTQAFLVADQTLMEYAKTRKRSILKSQPYFACKERHDRGLLAVKRDIQKHEASNLLYVYIFLNTHTHAHPHTYARTHARNTTLHHRHLVNSRTLLYIRSLCFMLYADVRNSDDVMH